MPRSLVVYYSLTGTNRRVAEALARDLGADLDPIEDVRPRRFLGVLRGVLEALASGVPAIRYGKDPAQYELVVVGGPVWGRSVAPPLRAYLHANRGRLPARVGCFCSYAGVGGGELALAEMRALAGAPDAPTLVAHERDVRSGRAAPGIRRLAAELRLAPEVSRDAAAHDGFLNTL